MRNRRRRLPWLLLAPLAVFALVIALAVDLFMEVRAPLAIAAPTTLEVHSGETLAETLDDLQQRQLLRGLRQRLGLDLWSRINGDAAAIKAGEYRLRPGLTGIGLLRLLVSGAVAMHELRLIEGWRFEQALQAVRADRNLKHLLPADADGATVMRALGHPDQAAEGRFFPDTYRFPKGETDIAFLRRAYRVMAQRLAQAWASRAPDLPYSRPYDALIMASLIEKETALERERPMIAGVFIRRLRLGMRLQTDPSVIYGLGNRYHGNLHSRDLTSDTPYNTYTRGGLPPTPICLPGEASLQAALHPAPGDALYFVSKGDGSHAFSATLAEHDANVRRYQLDHK